MSTRPTLFHYSFGSMALLVMLLVGSVHSLTKKSYETIDRAGHRHGYSNCRTSHPAGGFSWTMRLQLALLFPKFTKEQEMMMMEKKLEQMKAQQK